ncbi:cytochrome c-type biogenesis protein CcmH [Pseudochelatococcus lubricantis]|uniref:Cytochrome c-type biogenesis protein n=1 Tax=Pseudochelatococcus lubricantis TaxID=1538102 RepID=A0ABX0V0T0_9HYPH|nr:cytochrome c-type biogenesis protein [Pseudochelatococcus lubricantis]NIJ58587.1 cytochrome c-type biogenesis protein CcmH [Pseudochelatococcus lubricantis]
MRAFIILLCMFLAALPARAVQPDEVLPDAQLEQRARGISAGLRCLVCQNESIDDSDAPLARDLRLLVRDRLMAGDSDQAVKDFVVDRYGEFVLLRPVFGLHTALLWLGPFALLALGIAGLVHGAGRHRRRETPALTDDEKTRLDALLRKD